MLRLQACPPVQAAHEAPRRQQDPHPEPKGLARHTRVDVLTIAAVTTIARNLVWLAKYMFSG